MIHFILLIIIFCSCGAQKSITMAHVERIEERVMPIPVGADTIEIELCRDTRLECPDSTRSVNQRSLSLWRKNSVFSVSSVRDKSSVRACVSNFSDALSSSISTTSPYLLVKISAIRFRSQIFSAPSSKCVAAHWAPVFGPVCPAVKIIIMISV